MGSPVKLGLTLQQLAEMGIAPPARPMLGAPLGGPLQQPLPQPAPRLQKQPGMGRHIAGALGDFLLQQGGMQPVYAPLQREREQAEASEAQWSRRRQAENEDWRNRQQWQRANPEPSPMMRDLGAWQGMDPTQRTAYQDMKTAQGGDPDIFVTIGPGQFYSGPKSGLADALARAAGQVAAPNRPVGQLTPIEPTTQNTPAPETGPNGMPAVLTSAQYRAVVNAKGQAETDAWARRNNITVRD